MDVKISRLRDGGTDVMTVISHDNVSRTYYVDHRIGTDTLGRIYDDYPDTGRIVSKNLEDILLIIYNKYKDKK